ncbi:MAG TPA: alpha/beta hydrolase-fold protein [Vicinamibacteria bacterium]|nr:alpha/beta hydrolase-fold protein [Vicinamibacteria bacterium]
MTFRIRVHYPLTSGGSVLLRTEADWDRNVEPTDGGSSHLDFRVESNAPFLYFKPVLRERANGIRWSVGENYLALSDERDREIYPYFDVDDRCSVCEIREAEYRYRVFYPPGYHENVLERFPVLYMHDAQNLFFREEAFQGYHWRIAETLSLLDAMNLVRKVVVVGIYPNDRETDYTKPGYETYGRFLVEKLKPEIDRSFRTLPGPESTAVMGSSLGGVASFFMAWQWPEVFGMAACLSSTFGWRDDLEARVENEPRRAVRLYLDSGWPKDNYEATRNMRTRLVRKGYRPGLDLFYLGFPEALHNESSWAMRCHVPFQFLFGHR